MEHVEKLVAGYVQDDMNALDVVRLARPQRQARIAVPRGKRIAPRPRVASIPPWLAIPHLAGVHRASKETQSRGDTEGVPGIAPRR